MRHLKRVFTILPVLGLLLAGCTVGPATYQGPPGDDQNAASVTAGTVAESYSVSQGSSWIQIVAVDGEFERAGEARARRAGRASLHGPPLRRLCDLLR